MIPPLAAILGGPLLLFILGLTFVVFILLLGFILVFMGVLPIGFILGVVPCITRLGAGMGAEPVAAVVPVPAVEDHTMDSLVEVTALGLSVTSTSFLSSFRKASIGFGTLPVGITTEEDDMMVLGVGIGLLTCGTCVCC